MVNVTINLSQEVVDFELHNTYIDGTCFNVVLYNNITLGHAMLHELPLLLPEILVDFKLAIATWTAKLNSPPIRYCTTLRHSLKH